MNGAEHYAEAERLLSKLSKPEDMAGLASFKVGDATTAMQLVAAVAQVHATLSLAAATALATTHTYVGDSQEVTDWGHIVQPDAFTGKPCDDGCVDKGRNGCPPRCVAAQAAYAASLTPAELECPF